LILRQCGENLPPHTDLKKQVKTKHIFQPAVSFSIGMTKRLKLRKKLRQAFQWDRYIFQKMYLYRLEPSGFSNRGTSWSK